MNGNGWNPVRLLLAFFVILQCANALSVDPAVNQHLASDTSASVLVEYALPSTATANPFHGVHAMAFPAVALGNTIGFNVTHRMKSIPVLTGSVNSFGLAALESDPSVKAIFFDHPIYALDAASNTQIHADAVQNFLLNGQHINGTNQTICVIDTGINYTDPAFGSCTSVGSGGSCRVIGGFNFVAGTGDPLDDNGHGTHVAGIAAANGRGLLGVAPGAKLAAVKVMDSAGRGSDANLVAGIDWCITNRNLYNITSISISLGDGSFNTNTCDANPQYVLDSAAISTAFNDGIFVSVASGNSGITPGISEPACIADATAVGSVNSSDGVSSFSQDWSPLLLYAPGENINSTVPSGGCSLCSPSGFESLSGTSMATPHVAGVIALMQDLAQRSNGTLASVAFLQSLLNRTGFSVIDSRTGVNVAHSRVDANAALQSFLSAVSPRNIQNVSFSNASVLGTSYAFVNVSFVDDRPVPSACILQWFNGTLTNFSMNTQSGSCWYNVTGQDNVSASFTVYINDTLNNVGSAFFKLALDTRVPQQIVPSLFNLTLISNTSVLINTSFSDLSPDSCVLQLDGVNFTTKANATYCAFNQSVAEGDHAYYVYVNDTFGRSNQTAIFQFSTDVSPPTGFSFVVPSLANNSFTNVATVPFNVSFVEPHPDSCTLVLNSSTNYSMAVFPDGGQNAHCFVNVAGLAEGFYNYSVMANDTLGHSNFTALRFLTVDRTAPVIPFVNVSAFAVNRSSVFSILANATDFFTQTLNVTVSLTNGSGVQFYNASPVVNGIQYSFFFSGLALSDGNYTINVSAMDDASNRVYNASLNLTLDDVPPSAPVESAVSNASGFINVTWTAAQDAVGVDHYEVLRNGTRVFTGVSYNFTDWNAPFVSFFNYSVLAFDVAGNFNTSTGVYVLSNDSIFPRVSSSVSAANNSDGSVSLSWANVTLDQSGVTERNVSFIVYRTTNLTSTNESNMTELAVLNSLVFLDLSALDPSTSYQYVVAPFDANNNTNMSVTPSNSINETVLSDCSNAFSSFSACSGGVQSQTRTCLGRVQTRTQACTVSNSGGGGGSGGSGSGGSSGGGGGSSGGGSSGGSIGSSGSSGGGGGNDLSHLLVVQNIPDELSLKPGERHISNADISSYFTSYLKINSLNVTGIPPSWYDLPQVKTLTPLGKNPLPIVWHPPADARGNYSVVLNVAGISTSNGMHLNVSYAFQLVLPPAEEVQSQSAPIQGVSQRQAPIPTPAPVMVQPARIVSSDWQWQLGGFVLVCLLLAGLGYMRRNPSGRRRI